MLTKLISMKLDGLFLIMDKIISLFLFIMYEFLVKLNEICYILTKLVTYFFPPKLCLRACLGMFLIWNKIEEITLFFGKYISHLKPLWILLERSPFKKKKNVLTCLEPSYTSFY
jgi:hypothetical protein